MSTRKCWTERTVMQSANATRPVCQRATILLVEDDVDLLGMYELVLEINGFQVLGSLTTGEAAVDWYRAASSFPDVVLLDHRLPGMSGIQAARKILEIDPHAAVVFCTADGTVRGKAVEAGVRVFLRKPFDNDALIKCLGEAVSGRSG